MSQENKVLTRRIYEEVWNSSNLDALDDIIALDIVNHEAPPGLPPGREGTKAFLGVFMRAFPDTRMTVEDQLAEGDKVVTRWSATGTHTADLMGIPATGRQVTVTGIDIHRIAAGKVVETWGRFDEMGMMQQLGVVPPPGG